jgi:transposase
MRFVRLTEEERSQLEYLYKTNANHVVRERCQCLLLSDQGHKMTAISCILNINWLKIVRFFNAWESAEDKYMTLSIASGRGAKVKLESVKDLLPDLVQEHSRNLNPILVELKTKHNIRVCKLTLQNFLKDLGL